MTLLGQVDFIYLLVLFIMIWCMNSQLFKNATRKLAVIEVCVTHAVLNKINYRISTLAGVYILLHLGGDQPEHL